MRATYDLREAVFVGFMGTFIGTTGQPTLAVRGAVRVTCFALMGAVTVRRANTRERARSALKRVAGGDRPAQAQ